MERQGCATRRQGSFSFDRFRRVRGVDKSMKTLKRWKYLGFSVSAFAVCLAHAQFAGNWQSPPAVVTRKPIYAVRILQSAGEISGTLTQVFPNGNQQEWPILKPELSEGSLMFQTQGRDTTFYWRLTPKGNKRLGTLHGIEGPTSAGQRSGEMVIDFPVKNRR
jgi:hypothetical protein